MNQPPDILLDHLSTHDNTQFQTQNIQNWQNQPPWL